MRDPASVLRAVTKTLVEDPEPEVGGPAAAPAVAARYRPHLDGLRAVAVLLVVAFHAGLLGRLDPLQCISGAKYLDECRFVTFDHPTRFELGVRDLANGKSVQTLDIDKWVCPYAPICDPVVDGMIVRRDGSAHLTRKFATSLAPRLQAVLEADGFLSAPAK